MEPAEMKDTKGKALDGKETKKENKDIKVTFLKKLLGEEVTWSAIAAIGGALIIIWNIFRYFFSFISSVRLYLLHNIPLYLLMKRHNMPFSDMILLIYTILFIIIIVSFTEYNPYLKMKDKTINRFFLLVTIVGLLGIGFFLFFRIYRHEHPEINHLSSVFERGLFGYTYPFLFVPYILLFGKKYIFAKNQYKHISEKVSIDRKERIKTWKQKHMFPEEFDEYYLKQKDVFSTVVTIAEHFRVLIFAVCLLFTLDSTTTPFEYYIDQKNRIIIADLGEQYIVQDAKYTQENEAILIDISHYYVIDSSGENLRKVVAHYRYRVDGFE